MLPKRNIATAARFTRLPTLRKKAAIPAADELRATTMKRWLIQFGYFAVLAGTVVAAPPATPQATPSTTGPAASPTMDEPQAPAATGSANAPVVDSAAKLKLRQREGAKLIDRRGRFERRGERYVFLSEEGGAHFVVVENLMLERVANMLDDAAGGELLWNVSGVITEFRGANFLVLQRAVVKASGGPQQPRRLDDPLARQPAGAQPLR